MDLHSTLLQLYLKLGYPKTKGICFGFTIRYIEAYLVGKLDEFQQRVDRLSQNGDALAIKIKEAFDNQFRNISDKQRGEFLDTIAFFDSLSLYHDPIGHQDLKGKFIPQSSLDFVSPLAQSDAIQAQGGLKVVFSEPDVYNHEELEAYLTSFRHSIDTVSTPSNQDIPVTLLITSSSHAIAVTYCKNQGWTWVDINQYPPTKLLSDDTQMLVEKVFSAFPSSKHKTNKALNITCLTTMNLLNQIGYETLNNSKIRSLLESSRKAPQTTPIDTLPSLFAKIFIEAKPHLEPNIFHIIVDLFIDQVINPLCRLIGTSEVVLFKAEKNRADEMIEAFRQAVEANDMSSNPSP